MRVGKVIGNVTLSRVHPSLVGARWLIAVPQSLASLREKDSSSAEPIVVYDDLSAGLGSQIGMSEGREAAQPFHPQRKPVDAYCACILDHVEVVDQQGEWS